MTTPIKKLEQNLEKKNRQVFIVKTYMSPLDLLVRQKPSGLPVAGIKITDNEDEIKDLIKRAERIVPGLPTIAILSPEDWREGNLNWTNVISL